MPLSRRLPSLSLALALAGLSSVAWAQPQPPKAPQPQQQDKARPHAPREQKGLSESVRRAEREGKVLSAEQVQYDGRDVNRVKIVDDRGRVRVMWDDPSAKRNDGKGRQQGQGRQGGKSQDGGRTRSDDDGDPNL